MIYKDFIKPQIEIYKDQIKILENINEIAEKRNFDGISYSNIIYEKIKIIKSKLIDLENEC